MKAILNPMMHAYWKSHVMWVATPAGPRTGFVAGTEELIPAAIIDRAIAMAEQHVDAFLEGVVAGSLL